MRIVVGCPGSWCTACFASVTGGLRNFPFSPWVNLAIGCSVTSRILCAFVRSVVCQCAGGSDVCNDHARVYGSHQRCFFLFFFFFPCYLHNGQVRISVGIPCVGVLHMLHASLFFLAVWACACHASSRIRFTVYPSCFSLIWLFGGWTVATVSDI